MQPPHIHGGFDWRSVLAEFDSSAARLPASLHAAQLLLARGRNAEAEAALREFLGRSPNDFAALQALGMLLRRMGRGQEASEFLIRAARVEAERFDFQPDDREAVERFLATAEQCEATARIAPAAFVAAVFDNAAEHFDRHLRDDLKYRGPELLLDAVCRLAGGPPQNLDILDLGCGTGLAGELFRPLARRLDGVDLSSKMLEQAAAKRVYDRLTVGDVVEFLSHTEDRYDLIIAADLFIYLGDLEPVFTAARHRLQPNGWFAFTAEACEGTGYFLQPVRRFAHSKDYLLRIAGATKYAVQFLEEASLRLESYQPVRSHVCVLGRSDAA